MQIFWKLINPNSNAPITGGSAGTSYKVRRGADGYLFDFSDTTFKASGWTTLTAALTEVDATNLSGVYVAAFDTALWTDGEYQLDAIYSAGGVVLYATERVLLQDGVEAVTVGTNNDKTDYALTAAYDAAKTAATQASVTAIDGKADDIITDIYLLTHTPAGVPIIRVIPLPVASDTCVLFEYCYGISSQTPLASVTASCQIVRLPYDYDGKLHTGAVLTGTYTPADGLVQWEIVQGATVMVNIKEVGILRQVTIPNELQARVYDLL